MRTPTPVTAKSGQIKRVQIGLNVLLQLLIVVALVGMINFIGFRQFNRWDLSRNQKFALSPMTTNLLTHLEKPVKAIVFFNASTPVASDVNLLLREYEFTSKKKFEVEMVDPYNNVIRAKELAAQYKFGGNDNIVILDCGGRTKFVNAQDMVEYEQQDQITALSGQPPRITSFKGEQAITSALLEVTEDKQNKVYLMAGHGEPELGAPELKSFKAYTERQNIKLESLKLNEVDKVPEDASGLILIGARADYSEREMKLLREFWVRKARLFVLLDPEGRTPRLDTFLLENGIAPSHDRILRIAKGLLRDAEQNPDVREMVYISPTGTISAGGKEIAKDLAGIDTALLGLTQSLQLDQRRAQAENTRLTPLIEAAKGFWGETEYTPEKLPFFDLDKDNPGRNNPGPLILAAALEKGGVTDTRVKVETSRMIVVGNAGWITDDGLRMAEVGIDFAMNCLNWLLNREQLAGIPPKAKEPVRLDLDEAKLSRIALTVIVLIPTFFAALGVGAWMVRRS